jgi:hypothetical protein
MQRTQSRNLWLYCPLVYLFVTRLGGATALVGYIENEFVPFFLVLVICYQVRLWLPAIAFAGFLSLYEIAYVRNDHAATARESGGKRLTGSEPRFAVFALTRILFASLVGAALWQTVGTTCAALFLALTILIVALAQAHTWAGLQRNVWLRILTFAALAAYKSAAWLMPFLSHRKAGALLMTSYLLYGLPRTIAYAARKFDFAQASGFAQLQPLVQSGAIVLFAPVIWLQDRGDLKVLWSAYFLIVVLTMFASRVRRGLSLQTRRAHD